MDIIFFRRFHEQAGPFDITPAIRSARQWNPSSRVVLIGDKHQRQDLCEFIPMSAMSDAVNRVAAVFRYPHKKHFWWSWATLSQWLVLADYMAKEKVGRVYAPDTDVLTLADMDKESAVFGDADYVASCSGGSPQCPTFILNPEVMVDYKGFVNFLVWLYTSNEPQAKNLIDSGVDSMRLWDVFHQGHEFKRYDMSQIVNGVTFDHNIAMASGFAHDGEGKIIRFIKGQPHAVHLETRQLVRFANLHMWGKFKSKLADYVKASEDSL